MAVDLNSSDTLISKKVEKPPPLLGSVSMRLSMLQLDDVIAHSDDESSGMFAIEEDLEEEETVTNNEAYSGHSGTGDSKPNQRSHSTEPDSTQSMLILDETIVSEDYNSNDTAGYSTESTDSDRFDCLDDHTVTEFDR